MKPVKNWCLLAATRGDTTDKSYMMYSLPLATGASTEMERQAAIRLNGTLGVQEVTVTASPQQTAMQSRLDSLQAQLAAVSAYGAQAPSTGMSAENMFLRGVEMATRHTEERASTAYKRFTGAQQAKICGFCVVTTWDKVPKNLERHREHENGRGTHGYPEKSVGSVQEGHKPQLH